MGSTPDDRNLIMADVLETLSSVRSIKSRTGGVPITTNELLERKVTKDEELLFSVLDEMDADDHIPLEYASERQRTVWLTSRQEALTAAKEIYADLYEY